MHIQNKNEALELIYFQSAQDLPAYWNESLPENHFLQKEQLAITEAAHLPNLSFYYVMVMKNNQMHSKHYFQLLRLNKQHLYNKEDGTLKKILCNLILWTSKPSLLVSGHLFRHDICTFVKAPTISDFEAFQVYQYALQQIQKISGACAVLIKDAPLYLTPYFQNYSNGCLHLKNDVSMELALNKNWTTIQDYEKALKHKYAQRFRKIKKQENVLTKRILTKEDIETYQGQLYNLYQQVSNKQPIRLGMLSPEFIKLQHASKSEQLIVRGWFLNEELIAFSSAFNFKHTWDMFYIGFDYEKNVVYQLYFNILYDGLEQALLHKKDKIIYGRTALEAKARLGSKPNYLHTFVYISNPLLKWILKKPLENIHSKEGDWEQRHPLK
jgi:hypothetical protein